MLLLSQLIHKELLLHNAGSARLVLAHPSVLAALLYWRTTHYGFVYDDVASIQRNKGVTGILSVAEIFSRDFWGNSLNTEASHKRFVELCVLTHILLSDYPC